MVVERKRSGLRSKPVSVSFGLQHGGFWVAVLFFLIDDL